MVAWNPSFYIFRMLGPAWMSEEGRKPRLLVILGPTASGKTSLAIQVAQALDGEIISADSRILYQELNIGVAKPNEAELQAARHHLVSVASITEPWSLGQFRQAADSLIREIDAKGRLPILAGGTGQYLRALLQNWQVPEIEAQPELRLAIEGWGEQIGSEALWRRLAVLDHEAAAAIDHRNKRRTVRALEVILSTGQLFSNARGEFETPYEVCTLGLAWPRPELYARVDARIEAMFSEGLVEEVQQIAAGGKRQALERMGIIGYNEVLAYLAGELSLDEAKALMRRNTRKFVRRQANWFKPDDPKILWLKANDPALLQKALDRVKVCFS